MSRFIPKACSSAEDILDLGADHVVLATGSALARRCAIRRRSIPAAALTGEGVYHARRHRRRTCRSKARSSCSISTTTTWAARSAEHLARRGLAVTYVTPAGLVSAWTIMTNELPLIHASLARHRIAVKTLNLVSTYHDGVLTLSHLFTGERTSLPCRALVVVGHREPRNALHAALAARADDVAAAGIRKPCRHRRRAGAGRHRPCRL